MRITKPDVDLQAARQFRVAGHLAAAVVGHALAQGGGQPFHLSRKAFQRRVSGAAAHLAENKIAGLALDHRAHRRAVGRPLDQVTFLSADRRLRSNRREASARAQGGLRFPRGDGLSAMIPGR